MLLINKEFVDYFQDFKMVVLAKYEYHFNHDCCDENLVKMFIEADSLLQTAKLSNDPTVWRETHSKWVWLNYYLDMWLRDFS